MRSDTIKLLLWSTALVGQLAWPAMAATGDAETAPSSGLEEIVVTATRREERLQDIPVTVMAFSQEKLDSEGLHNIDDLARLSPGVNFQRNGMSSAGNYNDEGSDINIRGVDSAAGTATTGIYVDDTPIQTRKIGFGSINAFPALFDLDRVEVLLARRARCSGPAPKAAWCGSLHPSPISRNRAAMPARTPPLPTEDPRVTRAVSHSARPSSTTCSHFAPAFRSGATAAGSTGSATRSPRMPRRRPPLPSTTAIPLRRTPTTRKPRRRASPSSGRSRQSRDHAVDLLPAPADQRHVGLLGCALGSQPGYLSQWQCADESQRRTRLS